ncbi:hypothetical protein [Oceaniglobus ichthyenteri]|uniref:hypothetical protein n=1 Tax=Oceaniglobus ichthyenteri TaxID=2136177 RepID=UPI000D3CADA0|nr:hypothetical protein [Oceaniglobus ichthyenteri]
MKEILFESPEAAAIYDALVSFTGWALQAGGPIVVLVGVTALVFLLGVVRNGKAEGDTPPDALALRLANRHR